MRVREYLVFLYRIFLVYFFYAIARGLFIYFNHDVMVIIALLTFSTMVWRLITVL